MIDGMMSQQSLLALSVAFASCTTGWGKSSLPSEPAGPLHSKLTNGCPPPEFDLALLAHAALGVEPQPKVKEVRVLAWDESGREDGFEYVDEALLWIETEADGFVIAHVRTAHDDDAPMWHLVEGSGTPAFPGTVTMAAAPTHDQFERFLNQSSWTWAGLENHKLLSSNVCADAWTKSFDQPPWHKFAAPDVEKQ
jgi:hypothetical protein